MKPWIAASNLALLVLLFYMTIVTVPSAIGDLNAYSSHRVQVGLLRLGCLCFLWIVAIFGTVNNIRKDSSR